MNLIVHLASDETSGAGCRALLGYCLGAISQLLQDLDTLAERASVASEDN